jgi:hypothetical protein
MLREVARGDSVEILKFVQKVRQPFVTGTVITPAGAVQRVATTWIYQDRWGMIRSRISASA